MSFEQTYYDYFEALHRYAFTIVMDNDQAMDIVQDAFVSYYEKMKSSHQIVHVRAYLYKSVYNKALTTIKKQKTARKRGEEITYLASKSSNAQDKIIEDEEKVRMERIMENALSLLTDQVKTVFMKSRLDGKKYREIAAEMDLSIKTVEAHLSKALKIIRNYVKENEHLLSLTSILFLYELFI
ncbi:MAG TPA: RNA polymerase sigma-70 factor [Edaphocola sp.]|nr:RNA polymerase sigma-70 factor [Edaphocola sp.]